MNCTEKNDRMSRTFLSFFLILIEYSRRISLALGGGMRGSASRIADLHKKTQKY